MTFKTKEEYRKEFEEMTPAELLIYADRYQIKLKPGSTVKTTIETCIEWSIERDKHNAKRRGILYESLQVAPKEEKDEDE